MTSTTALKVGAAYIRVSTDGQMDLSPESQLESIVQYAKSSRIVIPKEYIFMESEGRSGKKAEPAGIPAHDRHCQDYPKAL